MSAPLAPTMEHERLTLIDSLRGFALAGVLLVNVGAFTLFFFLDPAARAALPTFEFDIAARWVHRALIDRKAVTLFSLLFGLGFAIQLQRAEARGSRGLHVYVRRLAVLFGIGLIHAALIWWGDILLMYALLGLLLIPFRHASDRVLLGTGLILSLVVPPLVTSWMDGLMTSVPTFEAMKAQSLPVFRSSGYFEVVRQNVAFGTWTYIGWWDDWFFIFGRFLLGFWAGRRGLFHDPSSHRELIARVCIIFAVAGIVGTALDLAQPAIKAAVPDLAGGIGAVGLAMIIRAGSLGLGVAYATGLALLFLQPAWRRRIEVFAPVGRMALTNYLTQSVVGVAVFYGMGLAVGPSLGYVSRLGFVALLFSFQIVFSRWWLARFRFGPMEWVWRSLTYWRREPLRSYIVHRS